MNILTKIFRTTKHPSLNEARRKCRMRAELKFLEFGYYIPKNYLDVVTLLMVDAYMGDIEPHFDRLHDFVSYIKDCGGGEELK